MMSSAIDQLNQIVKGAETDEKELERTLGEVSAEIADLDQQGLAQDEFQAKYEELTKLQTNFCSRYVAARKRTADLRRQRDELAADEGNSEVKQLGEAIALLKARCDKAESKLTGNKSGAAVIKDNVQQEEWNVPKINNTHSLMDNMYTPPANRVQMTSFSQPTVSYSNMAKSPKYTKEGQDICIFLDRFEQYIELSCHGNATNLELQLLSVIEDDKMYRKLKSICASLYAQQKEKVAVFVAAIRKALFPATEARMMRASLSSLKQELAESAEDYANRLINEAEKAFNPSELTLREEACLSTYIGGLREVSIKQKLMELDVKTFEQAVQLARKQETIMKSLKIGTEGTVESWPEIPVLRVGDRSTEKTPTPETERRLTEPAVRRQSGVVCWRCNGMNHVARYCSSELTENERTQGPQNGRRNGQSWGVTCYSCQQRGHIARYCPSRIPRNGNGPASRGNYQNSGNGNAAGSFPVHPSRQNRL